MNSFKAKLPENIMISKLEIDVRRKELESGFVVGPYLEALRQIEQKGYQIISLEENAKIRILEGADSISSKKGNLVREGIVYVPQKGRYIVRNSPSLQNPEKIYSAHENMQEYFLSEEEVSLALEDSVRVPEDKIDIPIEEFGEDPIANFCFGEFTNEYLYFLKKNKVPRVFLFFDGQKKVERLGKSYASQIRLAKINANSQLTCRKNLTDPIRIRGIKYF